jgi:cobalt-zinc-cadmium efflux system membrane fusion protein
MYKMNDIIITIGLGFVSACSTGNPDTDTPTQEIQKTEVKLTERQMEQAGITLGTLSTQNLSTELTVNGVVDVPPQNMISVSFPLGGYLKQTKLMPGMHVSKGEIIAWMEDQSLVQLQQDYLVTQARLGYLEQEYKRQADLNKDRVSADKTFQQVTADYSSQKITLRAYAEKLRLIGISPEGLTEEKISRNAAIRSPINGYVSKVNVNPGKFVQPADVLFELINPDDIHAALTVFEKDLRKVSIGQRVSISFVDEPEKGYPGEIILVNRNVDESRSAIAHCHFLSHPAHLLPGMFLNATIAVKTEQISAVPEGALLRRADKEYVFVQIAPQTFRLTEVTSGTRSNGQVAITSDTGQLAGKQIVTGNAFSVLSALLNTGEE